MQTASLWLETKPAFSAPKLKDDLRVDALVVGGGITGLTAAYLLRKSGLSVALVEKGSIGQAETGHTTAHLTYATDARLSELVKTFGREHAKAAWDAGASAMAQIQAIASETGINCELRTAPGFLVAAENADAREEADRLREDATLAAEMGFDAGYVSKDPLTGRPAMRLANQLKFHPLKYLVGLATAATNLGVQIFEKTEVTEFQTEPRRAIADGHRITFNFAVLATHVPLQGNTNTLSAALFQTKLAGYSTYAVEACAAKEALPEIMWWDTADPYLYLRVDGDSLIFGGEDHKTGQETNTEACFERLERKLTNMIPSAKVERRWSGQVIESVDGLPYIGEVGNGQYLATGFAGNGMTFGTLAGIMARDTATGKKNPWSELFAIERKTLSCTLDYLRENRDYPYYLAKGHLAESGVKLADLAKGSGKLVSVDGEKCAAFRDEKGKLHLHSAVCPHLGCVVVWNNAEHTWDCPCHGSRFAATGEVIAGPAEKSLEKVDPTHE